MTSTLACWHVFQIPREVHGVCPPCFHCSCHQSQCTSKRMLQHSCKNTGYDGRYRRICEDRRHYHYSYLHCRYTRTWKRKLFHLLKFSAYANFCWNLINLKIYSWIINNFILRFFVVLGIPACLSCEATRSGRQFFCRFVIEIVKLLLNKS